MRTVSAKGFAHANETEQASGIEKTMVAVVFLFASGIFDPSIVPKFGILRINDLFMITAAGFGVALQFTRLVGAFSKLSSRSLVVVFSVYALMGLSLLWSHSPGTGIPRFVGFSLTTLWTLYAATRFSIRDLLQILLITFLSIALISTLLAVAIPDLGTMTVAAHKGDWKGVYEQKNTLGRNMSLLVTVSLFCLIYSGPRGLAAVSLTIGMLVLVMSGSRTALGIGLLGMVSVVFLYLRRRPFLIIGITLGACIGGLFFALQTIVEGNPLLQLQGESLSIFQTQLHFTGRFGLWQFSLESMLKKPWFGYGFDGFWKVKSLGGQTVDLEGW
ncbi:MAG: O-antigen ligase family protein [Rhodospirillaceae bacterium]|nr:O-antigen ligase family protein [Rhodospirillaceae bacterium]